MPKSSKRTSPSTVPARRIASRPRASREHQALVERLESANEALKAARDEVLSKNQELQATSAQLTTSHEELQAMNEELHDKVERSRLT